MQTIRETDLLRSKGHSVYRISFDSSLSEGWQKNDKQHYNFIPEDYLKINSHLARIKRRIRKFFVKTSLKRKIENVIQLINPDIIHINNITYEPLTVYAVLRKYKSVQTVRDFGIVCPRKLCVTQNYKECDGYCFEKCVKICAAHRPFYKKLSFELDRLFLKKVNYYRKKSIDKSICPSENLANVCTLNGIPTEALNNAFDFSVIEDFDKDFGDKKKYLVYGLVAKHKGILQLVEAFKIFSKDKDVRLEIVGKLAPEFKEEFDEAIKCENKICYLGVMPYKEIISHLQTVYSVVVPSLWLENYPNTALEGLATRCVVLGSNRGGIPELIKDDRFVFDVLNIDSIIDALENSYLLNEKTWKKITDDNFERVKNNNSLEKYYSRIIDVFNGLIH